MTWGIRTFIQYGPLGDQAGKIPERRGRMAFRAFLGSMTGGLFSFIAVNEILYLYFLKAFTPLMMAILLRCMTHDLGSAMRSATTLGIGAPTAIFVGTAAGALCYAIGGMRFDNYIVVIALFVTPAVLVLIGTMGKMAKPSSMVTFLEPGMAFAAAFPLISLLGQQGNTMTTLLQSGTNTMLWFFLSGVIGAAMCLLPCGFGALPARVLIPSHLAQVCQKLAFYASAVAVGRGSPGPVVPQVDRRRAVRYDALRATAGFRQYCKTAKMERCGGYRGESPSIAAASAAAETCRLAINLQHTANNSPCTEMTRNVYFRGPFSENLQSVQNLTCRTLYVASTLAANVAGHKALGMSDAAGGASGPHAKVDAALVRETAEALKASVRAFRGEWIAMSSEGWQERKAAVSRASGSNADAPFEEILRANASILGAVGAADAAAKVAQHAADLAEELTEVSGLRGYCCPCPGEFGFYNSIGILTGGPSLWWKGIKKGWRFALRLGLAMAIIGILIASIRLPRNGIQLEYGTGAVLTAGICTPPVQGAALLKGIHRMIGTIAGALTGIALLLASQWEWITLWPWLGILAFLTIFFGEETQYAGLVFFTTVAYIVTMSLFPTEDDVQLIEDALIRMLEVAAGVAVAATLSIFVAPAQATTSLRAQIMEALSCSAFTFTSMARALSDAAPPPGTSAQFHDEQSLESMMHFVMGKESGLPKDGDGGEDGKDEDEEGEDGLPKLPSLTKLRESSWELMGALFYGGDGQPGTADTLQDTKWESRFGSDLGFELLGGLLWLPQACCPCLPQTRASGRDMLRAIPALNRQMKQSHIAVALLQPGFPGGGELLLGDPLVHEALGIRGEALASAFREAVSCLKPILAAPGKDPITQRLLNDWSADHVGMDEVDVDHALQRLDEVDSRLQLLLRGADAGRQKAGGGIMKRGPSPGTLYGGCSHRVAASLFMLQKMSQNLREVIQMLGGESGMDARTLLMPLDFDESDEEVETQSLVTADTTGLQTASESDDAAYRFRSFC